MSWRGQRIGSNLRYCHRHAPMPRTSNVVIRLPVFEDIGTFPTLLIYYTCPNAPRASRASGFGTDKFIWLKIFCHCI
jgi:hypothetical protein